MKWKAGILCTMASVIGVLSLSSLVASDCYENSRYGGHAYSRAVPRHISHAEDDFYEPYHSRRVYDRGHRHYHEVYVFPVIVDNVVRYRPYSYCEDRLVLSGSLRLPRLAIDFDFHDRDDYDYRDRPRYRNRGRHHGDHDSDDHDSD